MVISDPKRIARLNAEVDKLHKKHPKFFQKLEPTKEKIMDWQEGTIVGFSGSWQNGLALLSIKNSDGTIEHIHCDNAPTGRALDAMFDCIGEGHYIDNSKIQGQEIRYSIDNLGILEQLAFPE